jgi:hypothetical protein
LDGKGPGAVLRETPGGTPAYRAIDAHSGLQRLGWKPEERNPGRCRGAPTHAVRWVPTPALDGETTPTLPRALPDQGRVRPAASGRRQARRRRCGLPACGRRGRPCGIDPVRPHSGAIARRQAPRLRRNNSCIYSCKEKARATAPTPGFAARAGGGSPDVRLAAPRALLSDYGFLSHMRRRASWSFCSVCDAAGTTERD